MPNQFLSPEGDLENYFISESWLIDQYIGDQLWAWGFNSNGQLGVNNATTRLTPVTTFAGGSNWKQISCGQLYTAAVKTDGTLWSWGHNAAGGLGINSSSATESRSTPVTTLIGGNNWKQVSAGYRHTTAIKTDGTLWTWGFNTSGQLGDNTTTNKLTPITTFSGGSNWKQVSAGTSHTAAIKTDGTLWVWGIPTSGQLGIDAISLNRLTPITTFAGGTNWKQVSCGGSHTAAIKTDGTLWTWGVNTSGQLGDNTTAVKRTPVTTSAGGTNWKQVAGGLNNTAAVKTDGTLWVWGSNSDQQLGINISTGTRNNPVTTFAGGTNWKQVACGDRHMAALKTDGTLWTWGSATNTPLGINASTQRLTAVTTFAGGTNWKQVSCGNAHSVAVTSGTDPTYFIS